MRSGRIIHEKDIVAGKLKFFFVIFRLSKKWEFLKIVIMKY
jgi:hypothetical protein